MEEYSKVNCRLQDFSRHVGYWICEKTRDLSSKRGDNEILCAEGLRFLLFWSFRTVLGNDLSFRNFIPLTMEV